MKKLLKRVITFVLSLAMVVTSANFTASTVDAAAADDIATERNLALGKDVSYSGYKSDGNGTTKDKVTDGSLTTPYFAVTSTGENDASWHAGQPCWIVVDLGDYYDASSIDEIMIAYRGDSSGYTPVKKSYSIDYSVNGSVYYNAVPDTSVPAKTDLGANYETVSDVSEVTGKVRYVRVNYPKTGDYGVHIREIAVLATNPVKTDFTPAIDAKSVSLVSNEYNKLTYNIEASEGQEDYTYDVYLDNNEKIGSDVSAGRDYTVEVAVGNHSITVVSKKGESISLGINSEVVEVINASIAAAREFKSPKNASYVGNNSQVSFVRATSYYNEDHTPESAAVIFDGDVETRGEGHTVAYRTKAGEKPTSFVIDLGDNYTASQFDKVMLEYQSNLTYAGSAKIYVAETDDEDVYTLVGESTGYKPLSNDDEPYHVNTIDLDMSQYGLAGVRYVKITLDAGSVAYGYVLHEAAVMMNVDFSDATMSTSKTKYVAPTIPSKTYTGQTLTADVPASDDYTVVANNGGVNVGEYDVVLELNDFNTYYWDVNKGSGNARATLKFAITQADNEWTSNLTIDGWKYGQDPKAPSATAKFGTPTYTYSDSADGTFSDAVPTTAGKHYVKATVAETNNYKGISAVKEFTIEKADAAAPTGITTISATANQNADGSILNVDSTMEYKKAGANEYTAIEGTTIENLVPGTYLVRYKATSNYDASADAEVTVGTGRKLLVTLGESSMCAIKPQKESREVQFDEEYKFTLDIYEGYRKGANFAVLANGEAVSENNGVYTVVIKGDTLIEVTGLEEDIPNPPTLTAENTAYGTVTVTVSGMPEGDVANVYMDGVQIRGYIENGSFELEGLVQGTYKFTAEAVRTIYTSDRTEEVSVFVEGDFPISEQMKDPDYNLALNKNIVVSQWIAEGSQKGLNDGLISTYGALSGDPDKAGFGAEKPSYMVLDLEKTYDASTLGDIILDCRKNSAGDAITVKGRPYTISVSTDGVNYENLYTTRSARYTDAENNRIITNVAECIEAGELNIQKIRYIRAYFEKTAAYGIQVTEFAVIAPSAVEVEAEKCADAKSVTVSSDDFNEITYNIEAGDGQEDFVYNVYLDNDLKNPVALGVSAGEDHKLTKISSGAHVLTVVAVDHGKLSDGIRSDEVNVLDGNEEYTTLLKGATNIASKNNNAKGRIISVSSFFSADYNLTQSQVAIDGKIEKGEGPETTLRTGANISDTGATIIVDLGANYSTKQIEKIAIEYQNGRTFAADTQVWVAEQNKDGYYALVANETGYKAENETGNNVNAITLDKSEYGMAGIRYVKIHIAGGASNYGYMIHEIGVLLNTNASEAQVVEPKIAVPIPTLDDQVYTGGTVTAVIPNNNLYTASVNEGGVDAGEYPVTLVLKDFEHYYWEGDLKGISDETEVSFKIVQAANNWINEVDIDGWKFGEEAKTPSASAKYGEVKFSYGKTLEGSFTSASPVAAGNYYVKAEVAETPNYAGIVSTKAFTVGKGAKSAPIDIIARASTLVENADASIIGVDTTMEYRPADSGNYQPIYGDAITNIKSGLYYIRYKETENTFASEDTAVLVESGRKLPVYFEEGDHYVIVGLDDTDRYTYGTSCRFQVKIADGYMKGPDFKVMANDEVVKGEGDVYTIDAIRGDTTVTVTGIVAKPPVVTTTVAPTKATPAKAKIKKIYTKKKSAKKLKVSVKAVVGAAGYRWAVFKTKKDAKKNKKALLKKNTTKLTLTLSSAKLKKKKALFVRVRAYVIQPDGTYTYGAWSTIKKAKIKK